MGLKKKGVKQGLLIHCMCHWFWNGLCLEDRVIWDFIFAFVPALIKFPIAAKSINIKQTDWS